MKVLADASARFPDDVATRQLWERHQWGSCVLTPLRREGIVIGHFSLFRATLKPFADQEIVGRAGKAAAFEG